MMSSQTRFGRDFRRNNSRELKSWVERWRRWHSSCHRCCWRDSILVMMIVMLVPLSLLLFVSKNQNEVFKHISFVSSSWEAVMRGPLMDHLILHILSSVSSHHCQVLLCFWQRSYHVTHCSHSHSRVHGLVTKSVLWIRMDVPSSQDAMLIIMMIIFEGVSVCRAKKQRKSWSETINSRINHSKVKESFSGSALKSMSALPFILLFTSNLLHSLFTNIT